MEALEPLDDAWLELLDDDAVLEPLDDDAWPELLDDELTTASDAEELEETSVELLCSVETAAEEPGSPAGASHGLKITSNTAAAMTTTATIAAMMIGSLLFLGFSPLVTGC